MPTKAQIISDVELQLYQGDISDDATLEQDQIAFWLQTDLNALVATECNEKLKRGQFIPNIYIRKADCEAGTFEEDDCGNQSRVFFQLEDEVLALNNGGGIIRVTTEDGSEIKRASVQSLNLFNAMRFAKSSEANLLYTQEGASNIYVEGLKEADILFDSVHVWYVPKQDILSLSDTDEVLVSDLTLPILINSLVQRGKLQLYGTESDTSNDGQDVKNVKYHTAIQSPQNNE